MSGILSDNIGRSSGLVKAAGGGGAWNIISTSVASSAASVTFTGIDSTYDLYAVALTDWVMGTDNVGLNLRFGDSSGIDSGASDYKWHSGYMSSVNATHGFAHVDTSDAQITVMSNSYNVGNATGEGMGGVIYIPFPGDSATTTQAYWNMVSQDNDTNVVLSNGVGLRISVITWDRLLLAPSSGTFSGRTTLYGIAHE